MNTFLHAFALFGFYSLLFGPVGSRSTGTGKPSGLLPLILTLGFVASYVWWFLVGEHVLSHVN